jgi:uncharacterized protein YecT (DUF1311 family)
MRAWSASRPACRRPPGRAFSRLRQAADAFSREATREVDMSGTGAAGFTIRHAGRRDDEFMQTLFKAAGGKLPRAGAAQLARLDRELNAQYGKVLAIPSRDENHPERIGYSTVTWDDVRASERAWLAYRDAWTSFLAAARPSTDLLSVQAELTRQRIAQLKKARALTERRQARALRRVRTCAHAVSSHELMRYRAARNAGVAGAFLSLCGIRRYDRVRTSAHPTVLKKKRLPFGSRFRYTVPDAPLYA